MDDTIRIFDEDSSAIQFEAVVLSCEEDGDAYRVVLNRTAFFPEEGGQGCDKGTINDIPVLDVQEKDGVIYHKMKEPVWDGDTVSGLVDWDRRFDTMQQHTGEHIVSGIVHKILGLNNVGFHLSDSYTTMDYDGPVRREQLRQIEDLANQAVWKDIPVKAWYPDTEELSEIEYRSKKELTGPVRIVDIPGVDTCACCAPHVKRTGQVGLIKIVSSMSYKGGVRLTILCGRRALGDYREKEKSVEDISSLLSVRQEEAAGSVRRLYEEKEKYRQQEAYLKQEILENCAEALPDTRNVCFFHPYLDGKNMHRLYNFLKDRHEGLVGCFAGDDRNGYRYVLGAGDGDAREAGKALNQALSGSGGGSEDMFQGKLSCTKQEIENYFRLFDN